MGAEALLALEAVLALLDVDAPEKAKAYARTAIEALRAKPPTESPDLALPLASPAAMRMRALRARRANKSVTRANKSVTRDVTRDVTRSRAPVDRSSLVISKTSTVEREEECARAPAESVTRANKSVTALRLDPAPLSKLPKRPERPPPSDTPMDQIREWLTRRRLPPDHPRIGKFLDVYRNAKPKTDWPACWRNFLEGETTGRFARINGHSAPEEIPDRASTRFEDLPDVLPAPEQRKRIDDMISKVVKRPPELTQAEKDAGKDDIPF